MTFRYSSKPLRRKKKKTTVYLDEALLRSLKQLARSQGVSEAWILGEALTGYVAESRKDTARRVPKSLGFANGPGNLSERTDDSWRPGSALAMLIADTSGLLASIDRNDRHHEAVRNVLLAERDPVIVPELVLAELDYLVLKHLGREAEEALLDDVVEGIYAREPCLDEDLWRARELIRTYREHDIGLVDATILATAERLDAPRILTLDHRHFRTMKFRNRRLVTIAPADARR